MAALFDGNNYLSVALPSAQTVPLTLLCWHYADDDTGQSTIMAVAPTSSNHFFSLRRNDAGNDIYNLEAHIRAGASGSLRSAVVTGFAIQNWRSVVGRYISSSDLKIHVDDGAPVENLTTQTAPTTPDQLFIGARQGTEILPVGDRVGRAVIVTRDPTLVTPDELAAFNAGVWPPDIFGEDLLRFYDFPEGAGFLQDYEGNNDLTETGAGAITHIADPPGFEYGGAPVTEVSAAVTPELPDVTVQAAHRVDVAAAVEPAAPSVSVGLVKNPIARTIAAAVSPPAPSIAAATAVGRKTVRGTAGNDHQLYDETNNPHNAVLFDWVWFDAIGIANLVDAVRHSSGQVTTDAAGNWSIDLADSGIDIGDEGTLLIAANADPTDKAMLQLPVEFV